MSRKSGKIRLRKALTLLELIVAMAMITIVFAAVLPQFAVIRNSWDSKQGTAEALQNGRVLMDHINRNLSKAVRITDVSECTETTDGYIEFEDNDGNTMRYDIAANSYVEYGVVGNLSDLAGPVESLAFTCYDACDLDNPLLPVTDTNEVRVVKVDAVFRNSGSLGHDETFTTWVYLRVNSQSTSELPEGLAGWWKLDETSGTTAADCTCNGNDGTLVSMSSPGCWVTGQIEGALEFDGWNDYVNCGNDDSLDITGDITIALWLRADSFSGDPDIVTKGAYNVSYSVWLTSSGYVRFALNNDRLTSSSALSTGTWYHIAATRSGSTRKIYINGQEDSSDTYGSAIGTTSSSFTISTNSYPFNGVVDDVRVYDRALNDEEVAELAETLRYEEFAEAKAASDTTSITIPTPGSPGTVAILGSWTEGLTHTAETGSNRALIFTAHVEEHGTINLSSVTYGGQSMTKVIDQIVSSSSYYAYVVAYILDEAGIAAATSDTFIPSWSTTPDNVSYGSVFLQNVDQTDPIGASASDTTTSSDDLETTSLSTDDGDMVIDAAACGNTGNYTVNNGFTEAVEYDMSSSTGVDGYKSATGAAETPSVTHSGANRQTLIGFVVQASGGGIEGIEGDLLIAAVATDGSTTISPPSGWTEINRGSCGSAVTLGAWWKLADASESSSHQFTWSGGQQAYGWMMRFTGHDPTSPINEWSAGNGTSSTPTSPGVTTTVENCLILRLGAFDNDDITEDDPGLSGHTAITMDKSSSSAITLFQDDFEDDFSQWTDGGTTDWDITASQHHSGSYSAHAGSSDNDLISDNIDTSACSSFTIDFWYRDDDIDDDDNVYLQLYDGGSYDDRFELGNEWPEDTWRNYNETINKSGADTQYFRSDFRIKFEASSLDSGGGPGGSENLWIDGVMVTTIGDGAVSGGAGYVRQSAAGSSGTSTFTLTASQEARMLTIAIAPAGGGSAGCCGEGIRP